MAKSQSIRGWFDTPGRKGDRKLAQQLLGLEHLLANVSGKTVLDIGCAEGLISLTVAQHGARQVHGVEIVESHVEVARALAGLDSCCSFQVADANYWEPMDSFDVTLMLAVLHKLRDPTAAARRYARVTRETCVVRLPPTAAPLVIDERSGNKPHDIAAVLAEEGFTLAQITRGEFDEWCGYFVRT